MERLDFKVAGSNIGKYFIWCHYESCVFTNLSHQPQQCSVLSAVCTWYSVHSALSTWRTI